MVSLEALSIHSEEAEQAVIGSVLIDENCYELIKDWIPDTDVFYQEKHQKIWKSISELKMENIPVDLVNVSSKNNGLAYYITGLSESVPTTANVEHYAKIVLEKYILRNLIEVSHEVTKNAFDDSQYVGDILDDAESKIFNITEKTMI